jgi:predicted nucleic acid-binding protein
MKSVYLETSIISYLTSRPSRDLRAAAWQEITAQWWERERPKYELFVSELVIAEGGGGDAAAARRRLDVLSGIKELPVDAEVMTFASRILAEGGVPPHAQADAIHLAVACVHEVDYLLTWNCRHIDNAAAKPIIRSIATIAGYACPEICTPLELLSEESDDVPR